MAADLDCFEGYLVTFDEACSQQDIPRLGGQQAQGGEVQRNPPAKETRPPRPQRCKRQALTTSFKQPQPVRPQAKVAAGSPRAGPTAVLQPVATNCLGPEARTGAVSDTHAEQDRPLP